MKKLLTIAMMLILLAGMNISAFIIEAKGHYFNPSEKAFKDIYKGGYVYGAEFDIRIWKRLELWAGGSYFLKKGKLTFTKEETKLSIFPIGGGLRYRFSISFLSLYGGIGLNYYQYKESNPIGDVRKSGLGYVGKIGCLAKILKGLLIDIYTNYSYCKIKPADFDINIAGFETGIGIGYQF